MKPFKKDDEVAVFKVWEDYTELCAVATIKRETAKAVYVYIPWVTGDGGINRFDKDTGKQGAFGRYYIRRATNVYRRKYERILLENKVMNHKNWRKMTNDELVDVLRILEKHDNLPIGEDIDDILKECKESKL